MEEPTEVELEELANNDSTPEKEKSTENTENKENIVVLNPKVHVEKPFNLETEVGKLKLILPLFELAKHDAY